MVSAQRTARAIPTGSSSVDPDFTRLAGHSSGKFGSGAGREAWRIADTLGLQKMATLVSGEDLKAGSDGETDYWNKRVFEPDAVDVFSFSLRNRFAERAVACNKAVEDGGLNSR